MSSMFISKITIKNFRLFNNEKAFEIENLNIPDGTEGSGLNLFVGENGCGKTSLLDAFSLPLLSYKADSFALDDFFEPNEKTYINVFSEKDFNFKGTMPNQKYKGKGFVFEAGVRVRENKSYLSSIVVSDQTYIRADGETKPEDGKPDLRVSVNNPWSGSRFNENDILFLDKNRTFQVRSGTYNPTRFDRLMEDFDFQYIKHEDRPIDCNEKMNDISKGIENTFLTQAIDKFQEMSGEKISLSHINNWTPHSEAFLAVTKDNKQHIPLGGLGSGYEMIFSLLYSFYLSQQSRKQLIVFIDEPELHLHPKIQEDLVRVLVEFSKSAQIFLTTHSPLFVKQVLYKDKARIHVLKKENGEVAVSKIEERVLPNLSANEINYLAFGLPTEEYHNELYNEIEETFWNDPNTDFPALKQGGSYQKNDGKQIIFDNEFFGKQKGELINRPFKKVENKVTIHTYVRNKIHHTKDNGGVPTVKELTVSIEMLRKFL